MIQLADHIAYAVFRRYESGDTQYLDLIAGKFDEKDGIVHGLAHKEPSNRHCMCFCLFQPPKQGNPLMRMRDTFLIVRREDEAYRNPELIPAYITPCGRGMRRLS